MPPKKRRSSQTTDKSDDSEFSPITSKRRKKSLQYNPSEICQELYDTIRNYKDDDGRLLCEPFIRAPKRRSAPEYFDVVDFPIDILRIQQKLKTDEYEEVEQLTKDIQLLVDNAKIFYKEGASEYKDACDLWDLYNETKTELLEAVFGEDNQESKMYEDVEESDDEKDEPVNDDMEPGEIQMPAPKMKLQITDIHPPPVSEDLRSRLEHLLDAVMKAESGDRIISGPFQVLPSKEVYPDYYDVIKEPIDLTIIGQRIKENIYHSLDQMEKDLLLMVKNARTYNEPGSLVHKDAGVLKKFIKTSKEVVEHGVGPEKSGDKSRGRRSGKRATANKPIGFAYVSEDESDLASVQDSLSQVDADESEFGSESEDNALWALFKSVVKHTNSDGEILSEPFLKLPSKRFYPDYYMEIQKPICLNRIRKKIKGGHYSCLEDVAEDLELLFDNAQVYNTDDSRLFQDAIALQSIMRQRKKELEKFEKAEEKTKKDEQTPKRDEQTPKRGRGRPPVAGSEERKKPGRKPKMEKVEKSEPESLKERLWSYYKELYDYKNEDDRSLINIFLYLPSKEVYPDYYQVILEPIDMETIEEKIDTDKYTSERELINDCRLMFNNARHYNEEDSYIYKDADTLEKILKAKIKSMNPLTDSPRTAKLFGKKPRIKSLSPLEQNLQDLYDTIKDYTDSKGRLLSPPFIKLPTKNDLPDYYEVIKKPIDMIRIQQHMQKYENLEDMVNDFVLMFDNACKYNEPDSVIYKDALILQRICLEKKAEFAEDEDTEVPDVRGITQELMKNLFISVYNSQDEEGRCYSDSFAELPAVTEEETEGPNGKEKVVKKHLTFDQIKLNLDKGRYLRMDKFQEDVFEVFAYARRVSRTDSQLYEDAVEMQTFFVQIRDELCKNGELLLTPALSYTNKHLHNALEEEKNDKLPLEQKEDEEKKKQQEEEEGGKTEETQQQPGGEDSVVYKGQTYNVGDFVYIEPREKNLDRHIICIERLWQSDDGSTTWLHGNWFYRPQETFHLATKKFLEKEVFKSDFYDSIPMSNVVGKCYVMFVKEYFKSKPEGFADKDVFVCESRYSAKHKAFKKIKMWQVPRNESIKIVLREQMLPATRVESVFAEKVKKDQLDDGQNGILDKKRQTVKSDQPSEDGLDQYEQFILPNGAFFKIGDHIYLRSNMERSFIARIDKLWTDQKGHPFFHGPWFIYPTQVEHPPTKMFYQREVFLSSLESTNSLLNVVGKCVVLSHKDFCSCRPTEVPENHVYICESKYIEAEKTMRKISKGFKKVLLSPKVTDDEIYFFRKQITLKKEPSPLLLKASQETYSELDEESTVDEPVPEESFSQDVSISGFENSMDSSFMEDAIPKKKKRGKRRVSAFIVFAGDARRSIGEEHPDWGFGEISKEVGIRWAKIPPEGKEKYIEKARKLQAEQDAKQAEAERAMQESMQRSHSPASDSMSPASFGRPLTPGSSGGMPYHHGQMMPQQQGMYLHQQNFAQQQAGFHPQQQQQPPAYHGQQMPPQQPHPSMHHGQGGMPHHGMMPPPSQHGGAPSPRAGMIPPPQSGHHFPVQQGMMFQQQQQQQQHHGMMPQSQGMVPHVQPQYPSMHQQSHPSMLHQQPHPSIPHQNHAGMPHHHQQYPGSMQQGMTTMRVVPVSSQHSGVAPSPRQTNTPNTDMVMHQASPAPHTEPVPVSMARPPPAPPRPPSPMFVSVPPKTQRLVHSEAYLRYIENLTPESRSVSNWNKQMTATQENTPFHPSARLPVEWIPSGPAHHGNALTALWAMRDLMMKDALALSKITNIPS